MLRADEPTVQYADPGYQPDGCPRLPLGSLADVGQALTWLDANQERYTRPQVKRIRQRLRRAQQAMREQADNGTGDVDQ